MSTPCIVSFNSYQRFLPTIYAHLSSRNEEFSSREMEGAQKEYRTARMKWEKRNSSS